VGASAQIVAHVSAENRIYIFGKVFGAASRTEEEKVHE